MTISDVYIMFHLNISRIIEAIDQWPSVMRFMRIGGQLVWLGRHYGPVFVPVLNLAETRAIVKEVVRHEDTE